MIFHYGLSFVLLRVIRHRIRIALIVAIATTEAMPIRERSTQNREVPAVNANLAGSLGLVGHPYGMVQIENSLSPVLDNFVEIIYKSVSCTHWFYLLNVFETVLEENILQVSIVQNLQSFLLAYHILIFKKLEANPGKLKNNI